MASINIDSELMTNYISASPVAAGSHNVAVLDEKRMPMVFCLSSDPQHPRLSLLRRDAQGNSTLLDLHAILDIPESVYVQSFHVQQSWSLKLYLVIAFKISDGASSLILLKPFRPDQLQDGASILPRIPGDSQMGQVLRIYMSPLSATNNDFKYPDVYLVHKKLDQSTSWGSDITHVHADSNFKRWAATQELSTPENTSQILDVAPAISPYGQGLFVLYVTQGITKLYARFMRPVPHATDGSMYNQPTSVMCPQSARCIASILNAKGYTELLIAAHDGIHHLNVADSTNKDRPGKLILSTDIFRGLRQLYVAQDHADVTIWFRNVKGELGYARTKSHDLADNAVSSLLLPAGLSSVFSPVVTRASDETGQAVRQMVISNDKSGFLTLIEQSDDIGLWRRTPFFAPSASTPTKVKSYTITIRAFDPEKKPLGNGALYIAASSAVSAILNGQNILLSRVPTWYDCDQTGALDLIVPSDSLGAQTLIIENIRDLDGHVDTGFSRIDYDPSSKPLVKLAEKMKALQTLESFKECRSSDGERLFENDIRNDENTMKGAYEYLQTIAVAYRDVAESSSLTQAVSRRKVEVSSLPDSMTPHLVAKAQEASDSFANALMDGWFWVREQLDDVKEWLVEKAGSVWKFVCKIAGSVKEFVLDCVEKICEAATWIWEKVKVGWQKLVDFVGFVFNWQDILTTKETISSTITAGLDYAALKIDHLATKVDTFFDGLENTVDRFGTDIKLDRKIGESDGSQPGSKAQEAQTSTSTTWAQERLKNGGAASQTKADLRGRKPSNDATLFWTTTVAPQIQKLNERLFRVGSDITSLFNKNGSINANDVLTISKDVLKVGITSVRIVVRGLLQLIKTFINSFKELGNAAIEIPIFSWLYKEINNGHELSLFDAISLIIAIPTTVLAKLITGKAPPTFDNLDAQLLQGLLGDDLSTGAKQAQVTAQTKADWNIFCAEVAVGVTLTTGIIGVIKLMYKAATLEADEFLDELDEGPSSLFDIFGIVVDMVGCLTALPDHGDLPGAEYRYAVSSISFFRGAYHVLAFCIKGKGSHNFEEVVLGLDVLTVLADFGLSIAIGVEEHKAGSSWPDYDEDATNTGFVTTVLNAIAGISYFAAFALRKKQPQISAIGAAVMVGTMGGAAVLKGVEFKIKYDEQKRILYSSTPAF